MLVTNPDILWPVGIIHIGLVDILIQHVPGHYFTQYFLKFGL